MSQRTKTFRGQRKRRIKGRYYCNCFYCQGYNKDNIYKIKEKDFNRVPQDIIISCDSCVYRNNPWDLVKNICTECDDYENWKLLNY